MEEQGEDRTDGEDHSAFQELPGEHWEEGQVSDPFGIPLTKEMIRFGLSRIARTLDTFEFAYSRFDCRNKALNNIDILAKYIHLRIIDLGENQLTSCLPLSNIQNLLLLNVENNRIATLSEIPEFPFIQALCVRRNKLTTTVGLFPNCLAYLQLGDNGIEEIGGLTSDTFPWLTVLELKGNKIKSLVGIDLPKLRRIYLAKNQLKDLKGISGCPNLTHLHVRNNSITRLEGIPGFEKLEYVNLRGNRLCRYTQLLLLGNSSNIKTLILKDNPIATLADYKMEALVVLPNLRRLDKNLVLETDMMEARQIRNGREQGSIPGVMDDQSLAEEESNSNLTIMSDSQNARPETPIEDWVEGNTTDDY